MRYFLLFIIIFFAEQEPSSKIKICSWNLKDFGNSKSPEEIEFVANTLKDFDGIVLQEIVPGDGGPQAVAKLWDELNRKGAKWDYVLSDPTFSSSYKTERYACLWKTGRLTRIGDAWLEKKYNVEIDREPYFIRFRSEGKNFTLVNFHAITKSMQPETEIRYFKFLPGEYPGENLIFCGDFNCPESHSVFNPLKSMGYKPALSGQKTSLRQECINGDCLASEFDNIFYPSGKVSFLNSGIIHFYKSFPTIREAWAISDHVPVYFEFTVN